MSNIPILGQGNGQPSDRFTREYGDVHARTETSRGDLLDSEVLQLESILNTLMTKYETRSFTLPEFEQEAKDRFFDAGFAIDVIWHEFTANGKKVDGGLAPSITIVGRVEKEEFDHDRKVHEVTRNILELDEPEGVITADGSIHDKGLTA